MKGQVGSGSTEIESKGNGRNSKKLVTEVKVAFDGRLDAAEEGVSEREARSTETRKTDVQR